MIRLHNTLSGTKEEFAPLVPQKAGLYHCGPTVYDHPHIGNLRSYVFADILRRTLEMNGYETNQVINITDIGHLSSDLDDGEDKMTKGLKREGKTLSLESMHELGEIYTQKFIENLKSLNIKLPHSMPKASDHIKEDIEIMQSLEKKGFIYTTSDGVYFDTSKDPAYGKLTKKAEAVEDLQTRIGSNPEKRNPRDFALWKFNNELGFPSPWGQGFPGWHIECSAMSMKYLGNTFDIHTGGIDHIPVHHNNEIAQSENATGSPFVHYWMHHGHVIINNEKMAKSSGNFLKLQDLITGGIDPLSYRYWLLGAHYRTQMNYTDESIHGAQNAYKKLSAAYNDLGADIGKPDKKYLTDFTDFINDDLDTPKALALTWTLLKDDTVNAADKKATLHEFDKVFGLNLHNKAKKEIPGKILKLIADRDEARKNKDFARSDELRSEIEKMGFVVRDGAEGTEIEAR